MAFTIGLRKLQLGFRVRDARVPNIEQDYILLLGKVFFYKKYDLTWFNPQNRALLRWWLGLLFGSLVDVKV